MNVIERRSASEGMGDAMFTGMLSLDLLLGDVRSLKQKRSVVRPIVTELRRRLEVSAAEVGHLDLYRRAEIGVAVVAADPGRCRQVLETAERMVAARPEIELLSAHHAVHGDSDWDNELTGDERRG